MKWTVLATFLVGCTDSADIGISNQPITCGSGAGGAANGTVSNPVDEHAREDRRRL